jgi:hypothetical protein
MTQIIDIAAVFGLFSCFLAVQNATGRVLYRIARDAALPTPLGRVHTRLQLEQRPSATSGPRTPRSSRRADAQPPRTTTRRRQSPHPVRCARGPQLLIS